MQQQFYQNQRYSFGDFDTKKITLFYSGPGIINSTQTTQTLISNTIITNYNESLCIFINFDWNFYYFLFNMSKNKKSQNFIFLCSFHWGDRKSKNIYAIIQWV